MMAKRQKQNAAVGFTLMELLVSMAVGLILIGAVASLFRTGMNSALLLMQRAETQQNMRAAVDLMVQDISMAGAGLPTGGIQLPTGTGNNGLSVFGCNQSGTCYVPNYTYPSGNYMYGIIPGYENGVQGNATIPAAPSPAINDSITVIYADYNFPLWEYNVNFASSTSTSVVNVTLSANSAYSPAPPAINSAGGINVGDLIMISGGGLTAVGEVTGLTASTMAFANSDALNINQGGAASGTLNAIYALEGTTTAVTAYRLFAVTYYLTVPGAGQTPRLMRQVNGLTSQPVADDIINLQFTYDVYNSTTEALDSNQANPLGVSESPNLIQKINLVVMGQSIINAGNKSQNMYLATDVSARNMAFRNRY